MPTDPAFPRRDAIRIADAKGFGLVELASRSGVTAQFLPTGALFALRHRQTLINQVLPGPAEDGLFRLLMRWWTSGKVVQSRPPDGWGAVAGAGLAFGRAGPGAVMWSTDAAGTLAATTTFVLDRTLAGWTWRVRVRNTRSTMGTKVSRCFERAVFVLNRSSCASPGNSSTSVQKRSNCALLPTVMTTGPSCASKTP